MIEAPTATWARDCNKAPRLANDAMRANAGMKLRRIPKRVRGFLEADAHCTLVLFDHVTKNRRTETTLVSN